MTPERTVARIDYLQLRNVLEAAALSAGAEILRVYEGGCAVSYKPDDSPVTAADHASEAIVIDALRTATPGIPVVAEEQMSGGHVPGDLGERFWLVDPLDGTREFIERCGDFTVNIALIEHGTPTLGIVYAPARGWLFTGAPAGAHQAFVSHSGQIDRREPIRCRTSPPQLTAVVSRAHASAQTQQYLDAFDIRECVSIGSSIKFCLVAKGDADLYPRLGRTMEWDTAAGDAVLRAAGGMTATLDGAPLTYGQRGRDTQSDFANPPFVAFGNEAPRASAASAVAGACR